MYLCGFVYLTIILITCTISLYLNRYRFVIDNLQPFSAYLRIILLLSLTGVLSDMRNIFRIFKHDLRALYKNFFAFLIILAILMHGATSMRSGIRMGKPRMFP